MIIVHWTHAIGTHIHVHWHESPHKVPNYTAWWTEAHWCEQLAHCNSRELNPWPLDYESDTLTTTPPSQQQLRSSDTVYIRFCIWTLYVPWSLWAIIGECAIALTAKEIRLRHGAPVIMVEVIDRMGRPLPAPLEVQHERAKAPDMTGGHQVIVCSREQLKVCRSSICALCNKSGPHKKVSFSEIDNITTSTVACLLFIIESFYIVCH